MPIIPPPYKLVNTSADEYSLCRVTPTGTSKRSIIIGESLLPVSVQVRELLENRNLSTASLHNLYPALSLTSESLREIFLAHPNYDQDTTKYWDDLNPSKTPFVGDVETITQTWIVHTIEQCAPISEPISPKLGHHPLAPDDCTLILNRIISNNALVEGCDCVWVTELLTQVKEPELETSSFLVGLAFSSLTLESLRMVADNLKTKPGRDIRPFLQILRLHPAYSPYPLEWLEEMFV